jgi:ABC-2 type transport system permease protein
MNRIFEIVKKNWKLLIRSKTSALIVLVGPLLLMLLFGLAFNSSSLFDIKIGTYSDTYSDLSNSINVQLEDDEFSVIHMNNEEICKDSVRKGDIHVCVVYPDNLNVQSSESVIFYVDKTRMNLVYIVINSISQKLSVKSSELSTALTTTLVNAVDSIQSSVSDNQESVQELSVNLNDALSKVNSAKSDLSNIDMPNLSNIDTVNLSDDLVDDINDAKIKITAFLSAKEQIDSALENAQTSLGIGLENTQSVQNVVSDINNNIGGIQIKEVANIVNPIKTEVKAVISESSHLAVSFPSVFMLVLLFAGVFISSTVVISEKTSKAFFRNFVTPTSDLFFIIGDYLSNLSILLLQGLVIFGVMLYVTKTALTQDSIINLVVIFVLVSTVFVLLGSLIGYLFKNEETANIASISISFLLILFSNLILPIETLPVAIRKIVNFNPVMLGESALRRILLFQEGLDAISAHIYVLLGYVVVLFILVYLAREFTKRRI